MQVCKAYVTPHEARSESDFNKVYVVTLRSPEYPFPTCTCTAYAIKRNRNRKGLAGKGSMVPGDCKHVQRTLRDTCTWIADSSTPRLPNNICPECGGPLIEFEDHVTLDMTSDSATVKAEGTPTPKPSTRRQADDAPVATINNLQNLVSDLLGDSGN